MPEENLKPLSQQSDKIVIYTDGSCKRNPGPGGSAAIIFYPETVRVIAKNIGSSVTNNKAELTAIKLALQDVVETGRKEPIVLYSDSEYSLNSIAGQYNSQKNRALITDIQSLVKKLLASNGIRLFFVRGHAGIEWNEACDKLAALASSDKDINSAIFLESEDSLRDSIDTINEAISLTQESK